MSTAEQSGDRAVATARRSRPIRLAGYLVSRPTPANVAALAIAVVAGVLVATPAAIPFGWVAVLAATIVMPAAGLAWFLGLARSWWLAAIIGLPLAFGLQLPAFVLATTLHWPPSVWAIVAVLIGVVPATLARPRREDEIGPFRPTPLIFAAMVAMLAAGIVAVTISGRDSDDWTYAANMADIAAGYPLAATDSVLGSDIPMIPRERLDLWVGMLGIGLSATDASAPVLIQEQLPPVIAIIAILAAYLLAAAVGGHPAWGAVGAFATLAWFAITPSWPLQGDAFLTRIGQDKVVAWIALMPLSILPLVAIRRWRTRRGLYAMALLAGLGIAAIHPVTQAIETAALVVWAMLALIARLRDGRRILAAAIVFAAGMSVALIGLFASASLGPVAGSVAAERVREATEAVTAASFAFNSRLPRIILNPALVLDALAITMSLIAIGAVLIHRSLATTLAASLVVTTVLIGFNPLVTPLLAEFLGDYLGVGLLLRVPWILPVGIALPALASAWRERARVDLPLAPLIAAAIVIGCALPQTPTAAKEWRARIKQAWRDNPSLVAVAGAIALESAPDDLVLAPKTAEYRVPAYDPRIRLLASRGLVGTVPHFPTDRVGEGLARADAVDAFFKRDHARLTLGDVATIRNYGVRYLVVSALDERLSQIAEVPGFTLLLAAPDYSLFRVDPTQVDGGAIPPHLRRPD
jgi:hypothetical protein